jgi:hypothetical protein
MLIGLFSPRFKYKGNGLLKTSVWACRGVSERIIFIVHRHVWWVVNRTLAADSNVIQWFYLCAHRLLLINRHRINHLRCSSLPHWSFLRYVLFFNHNFGEPGLGALWDAHKSMFVSILNAYPSTRIKCILISVWLALLHLSHIFPLLMSDKREILSNVRTKVLRRQFPAHQKCESIEHRNDENGPDLTIQWVFYWMLIEDDDVWSILCAQIPPCGPTLDFWGNHSLCIYDAEIISL